MIFHSYVSLPEGNSMIFYVFACAYTQRGELNILNMPMICHAAPQRYPSIVGRHDPHLAFTCLNMLKSFPSISKS